MTESQRVVSITSDELNQESPDNIPSEIREYRTLSKKDLVDKVLEARVEIKEIKGMDKFSAPEKEEIISNTNKKDHHAIANELYKLRMIIKDLKAIEAAKPKGPAPQKGTPDDRPTTSKRGRPKAK